MSKTESVPATGEHRGILLYVDSSPCDRPLFPKSCSCRWGLRPPPPALVWAALALFVFFTSSRPGFFSIAAHSHLCEPSAARTRSEPSAARTRRLSLAQREVALRVQRSTSYITILARQLKPSAPPHRHIFLIFLFPMTDLCPEWARTDKVSPVASQGKQHRW